MRDYYTATLFAVNEAPTGVAKRCVESMTASKDSFGALLSADIWEAEV